MTNIFNDRGGIRTDINPQMIPADRRAAYLGLVAAQRACEQTELNEKNANARVDACVRTHDDALALIPHQTVTSLVKETFNLV